MRPITGMHVPHLPSVPRPEETSQAGGTPKRNAVMTTVRLMGPHVLANKGLLAAGTGALLLEVAFRVMEPWPMKIVIDSVLTATGLQTSGLAAAPALLIGLGLLQILVVAGRAACNYMATLGFALVGSRASASLRAKAFRHVQGLSLQFHARNRSADTVQRIVSDVSRMQDVAVTAGLPLVANVLTLVVMVVVMVVLDPVLALIVIAAVLLFAFTTRGTSRRITVASRKSRAGEGQLANTAQESLASIKVVQAYGLESHIEERFVGANTRSLKAGVSSLRLAARLERGTDIIVGLAVATVMIGGGFRVLDGAMTVGELVLFVTYLRTTMKPLRDMAKYTGRISRASASGERVADLLAVRPEITSPERPVRPLVVRGALSFEQVVTQYDGVEVLRGIDLSVRPGENVAVVGPSGAGKSTLISLVMRAQDPVSGRVLLDGVPLPDLDLADLRTWVTVLHQDAVLLAGTIRENIALGDLGASPERIEAAARAANAHDFIMELPQGYDTPVGERGGTLSGGQRQRIAIARALLRNSPVILLDEATTGLDPEATTLVLDALDALVRDRTTLTVTHQAEAAMRADRILWVEDGRILMDASPCDLLATSEVFRQWAGSAAAISPVEGVRP